MNERLDADAREQRPFGETPWCELLGDKRRRTPGCWPSYLRADVVRNGCGDLNSLLSRRSDKSKSDEGGGEVLVQLADEAVAASGLAVDRRTRAL